MFKSQSYENEINSQLDETDFLNIIFGQQHNAKCNIYYGEEKSVCPNYKKLSNYKECVEGSLQPHDEYLQPYYEMNDNGNVSGLRNTNIHERWEPGEILNEADEVAYSFRRAISEPGTPHKDSVLARDCFDSCSITSEWTPRRPGKKRGPRPKKLTTEEKRQKRHDANNRERQRMGQLNYAFDNLRHLLPKHGNDRELSKFETIQIAKNYIKALNDMIRRSDANSSDFSTSDLNPGPQLITHEISTSIHSF